MQEEDNESSEESTESDGDGTQDLYHLGSKSVQVNAFKWSVAEGPMFVSVSINNILLPMELDTGTFVSVISKNKCVKLFSNVKLH